MSTEFETAPEVFLFVQNLLLSPCSTCSVRTVCVCGLIGRGRVRCAAPPSPRACGAGRTVPPRPTSRFTELSFHTSEVSSHIISCNIIG